MKSPLFFVGFGKKSYLCGVFLKHIIMRAVEFKTKIRENKIIIPRRRQNELLVCDNTTVRVIVFVEDTDEDVYRQMTKSQFLKGYADSDSIYD